MKHLPVFVFALSWAVFTGSEGAVAHGSHVHGGGQVQRISVSDGKNLMTIFLQNFVLKLQTNIV
jgi:hypothetical protein